MTTVTVYHTLLFILKNENFLEVLFQDQGGMGHLMSMPDFDNLPDELNLQLKNKVREYFDVWFRKSAHPDFHIPPSATQIRFENSDGNIIACIKAIYRWRVDELHFDKDYIKEYGGVIDETGNVMVHEDWGDYEILPSTIPFDEGLQSADDRINSNRF